MRENSIICINCKLEYKPDTVGVTVAEMFSGDRLIYGIWQADMLVCHGCGHKIVAKFAQKCTAHYEGRRFEKAVEFFESREKIGLGFRVKERA